MSGNVDWDLLTMYVLGECSEDQEKTVERWLAEDPVRKGVLDDLREVYENTGKTSGQRARDRRRQDQIWAQVEAHMERETDLRRKEDRSATVSGSDRCERVSRRFNRSIPRVAAILIAVALLAVLAGQLQEGPLSLVPDSETKTFVTQRGERATIRLADSTRVRLNADSRLEILPDFEAGAREVRLQGEAYFEVIPDASRPFLVHAGGATTEVLGTEFVVNAYSNSPEVVVAEGKVAFRSGAAPSQKESARKEVVLTRRQAARLTPDRRPVVRKVDLDSHLAWLRGELAFEDATFDEVARRLERKYDIEVNLAGPPAQGQFTARFSEEKPLDKVLAVIASVFDLEYKRKGSVVTFSPSG